MSTTTPLNYTGTANTSSSPYSDVTTTSNFNYSTNSSHNSTIANDLTNYDTEFNSILIIVSAVVFLLTIAGIHILLIQISKLKNKNEIEKVEDYIPLEEPDYWIPFDQEMFFDKFQYQL